MTTYTMELTITAEADVIRACCGKSHEFGCCPTKEKESESA